MNIASLLLVSLASKYPHVGLVCVIAACSGSISGYGANNQQSPSTAQTENGGAAWLRLTNIQYQHTLRDLLGYSVSLADTLPDDEYVNGFELAGKVSALGAEKIALVAEQVAAEAIQDTAAFIECDPAVSGEQACIEQFIDRFATRAFRRPVNDTERSALLAMFDSANQSYDFSAGVQVVIEAILQSPSFLYRQQRGQVQNNDNTVARLDDWEMASRLSYFIWNTMPDQVLFDAAAAGTLHTPEEISAQADRMLDDPKAEQGIHSLFRQWLHWDRLQDIQKDATLYPDFDQAFAHTLYQSLEHYIDEIFWDPAGNLEMLLVAPMVFANEGMAQSYEFDAPAGEELSRIDLDGQNRIGLLGQPGLLALLSKANQSDPIHRGVFVRQQLLCQQLPPPPNDIVINIAAPAEGLSTRERFAQHSTDPSCNGCHKLIDPVGFGFEEFGAIGEYREEDQGVAIDASGSLIQTSDIDGDFVGLKELSQKLSTSSEVASCVSRRWFRIALSRVEGESDETLVTKVADDLFLHKGTLRAALLQIVISDAFATRKLDSSELSSGGSE